MRAEGLEGKGLRIVAASLIIVPRVTGSVWRRTHQARHEHPPYNVRCHSWARRVLIVCAVLFSIFIAAPGLVQRHRWIRLGGSMGGNRNGGILRIQPKGKTDHRQELPRRADP